jgi:hypothetical protein
VIVTEAFLLVANVVTEKVAEVVPAGIRTLAGTFASAVFDEVSATVTPPEGAAEVSVTVPVDGDPPITALGFKLNDDSAAAGTGLTVSVVVLVTPL